MVRIGPYTIYWLHFYLLFYGINLFVPCLCIFCLFRFVGLLFWLFTHIKIVCTYKMVNLTKLKRVFLFFFIIFFYIYLFYWLILCVCVYFIFLLIAYLLVIYLFSIYFYCFLIFIFCLFIYCLLIAYIFIAYLFYFINYLYSYLLLILGYSLFVCICV